MNQTTVIAICGGSGSGKSTLVRKIAENRPGILVINMDHYYLDRSHLVPKDREKINYDHPDAMDHKLLIEHLQNYISHKPVSPPIYDFKTHTRVIGNSQNSKFKMIVLDGIFSLCHVGLRKYLDHSFYIDVDAELRLFRRILRDTQERNRSPQQIFDQYFTYVKPMYHKFIEPSKKHAQHIGSFEEIEEKLKKLIGDP